MREVLAKINRSRRMGTKTNSEPKSVKLLRIIWSFCRIFLYFLSIFLFFFFFWFAFLGIGFSLIIFIFSKKGNWSRHGIVLALTIGVSGLLVKVLGAFYLYLGIYFLLGYILVVIALGLVKKIENWVKRRNHRKSIKDRELLTFNKSSSFSYLIKIVLILAPMLFWSVLYFPRFSGGVELVASTGKRQIELLDRGIIAMRTQNGSVYVGWRLLEGDPHNISFSIYRANLTGPALKLGIVNTTTDFLDNSPPAGSDFRYWVRSIVNSTELAPSKNATILNNPGENYFSIKLSGNYTFQKVGIADLNGDGAYDFIIKQPNINIDPLDAPLGNWRPSEGTYKIEAYLSNGTFLWRRDLGWNIEQGVWYSPFIVYDFNGDNRAEIAIKTGEEGVDYRDCTGKVRWGPEYLSLWDGMTGSTITQVAWPTRLAQIYNFNSRNQLGVAFLDGNQPSLLVARGTYWFMQLEAYHYDGSQLQNQWKWENSQESGFKWVGQGAHFMHCADVDMDSRDEVILGSCVVNDNGVGLWSTGLQHPDHCYVGDIDPTRPGLEIYYGIEGIMDLFPEAKNGICLVDASTGQILWGLNETTIHIHSQGLVADIDPRYPGVECYSGEAGLPGRWLHAANGTLIATETSFDLGTAPHAVYWDADLQRELLYNGQIYDFETGFIHLEGVQGYQVAWADILGDWREEIIISVPGELRIYTTMIPAVDRRSCLMEDSIYRIDVAHLSMGYGQLPMTSFCLDSFDN